MSELSADRFDEFYEAVHKDEKTNRTYKPFPWQTRLAKDVCAGSWPETIALPTAAGKTACIEIALFALACGAKNAPRRILFVVDRRIVVDQAYRHAEMLADKLKRPKDGILKDVADALSQLAHPGWSRLNEKAKELINPLEYYALRGGMYRETAWTKSPLQPTIITSTVDQVGSRLLFRGYGVSDGMLPIHAALVGNDALIILDEAHCAKPFDQTLQAVKKYRDWNKPLAPFHCVTMTATPISEDDVFRENEDDRNHEVLGRRIKASKPAALVPVESAKGKNGIKPLLQELEKQARELSAEGFACVGIIVNRVKTARELQKKLGDDSVLLTGRMRPLDRDRIFEEKLKPLLSNHEGDVPKFVIGTQCLECGADFDFHALVTECASLDALKQRFGRLNRIANPSRTLPAKAVIVIRGDETTDTETDPIYGKSLAETWQWLNTKAVDDVIDFGIAALKATIGEENISHLNAPSPDAPVLFPAHLDCWVQTNPKPTPDPDPALFLHGPKERILDVKVVFRDDLGSDENQWIDIVALCPPSSSEAVAVPIKLFKRWLAGEPIDDATSDVEGEIAVEDEKEKLKPSDRHAVCWQGQRESILIDDPKQIRPERVYVVPCQADDVGTLADFIELPPRDYSELAFQKSRDRALLRFPDSTIDPDDDEALAALIETRLNNDSPDWEKRAVEFLTKTSGREWLPYPSPDGTSTKGFVVTRPTRMRQFQPTYLNDSEASESFRNRYRRVTLIEHSRGVADHAECFAKGCNLDAELFRSAGLWHDLGKLDPRFQAMLKQTSPRTAVGEPWAKSKKSPRTKKEAEDARLVHRYPSGARHELLSTAMLEGETLDDLLLHLIATHHGHARPFADAVTENEAIKEPFEVKFFDRSFAIDSARQDIAKWNAMLPERFWSVVREHGWWGSAYLEGVFRIADQAQSALEQEIPEDKQRLAEVVTSTPFANYAEPSKSFSLALPGLDGSNPLAFLAALGTLVVCDRLSNDEQRPDWLKVAPRLSWGDDDSPHIPILHFTNEPPTSEAFARFLAQEMPRLLEHHPASLAFEMLRSDEATQAEHYRRLRADTQLKDRSVLDWITALFCESAPGTASQLQTVRKDYLVGNVNQVLCGGETTADQRRLRREKDETKHQALRVEFLQEKLFRTLFETWDYADPLDNQSLHWEPSEDRRHAYQWNVPSGDPTRKQSGGMLGANRLGLEAFPLFLMLPDGERIKTRGFRGNRANNTFWIWPLWSMPASIPVIATLLSMQAIQDDKVSNDVLKQFGIEAVFKLQRILVGKTPNFTPAVAIA